MTIIRDLRFKRRAIADWYKAQFEAEQETIPDDQVDYVFYLMLRAKENEIVFRPDNGFGKRHET